MRFVKVMSMKHLLTITRKGQTTLPAAIRHELGVGKNGGVLQFRYDGETGQLIITKPMTIAELTDRASQHIKPGMKPVADVSDYYQSNKRGA
jgi:bifunctional DNA-binding transcriptional regulator/antitoxin component of YhaV-PrlF toxin-antitoxin module